MKFEWEVIKYNNYTHECRVTQRASVFGGWLVNTRNYNEDGMSEAMVFIPDPNHQWSIENE